MHTPNYRLLAIVDEAREAGRAGEADWQRWFINHVGRRIDRQDLITADAHDKCRAAFEDGRLERRRASRW